MTQPRRLGGPMELTLCNLQWGIGIILGLVILVIMASVSPPLSGQDFLRGTYDLSKHGGSQEKLPRSLTEISGLAVSPQGRLFAHNDERAVIYEVDPNSGDIVKHFSLGVGGAPGDYEGIALVGERFFLTTSDGVILETVEGSPGSAMSFRTYRTGLGRICEVEGLAYETASNSLLLPCKTPRTRELRNRLTVFSVDLGTMILNQTPRVDLPLSSLEELNLDLDFHPSAIEIHPETNALILLAAREETVLEISADGTLLGGRELHRGTHPQPEGITFLPDGSLALADEGQGKRGRLTLYPPSGQGEGSRR